MVGAFARIEGSAEQVAVPLNAELCHIDDLCHYAYNREGEEAAAADRRSVVTQGLDRDPGQRATARADALKISRIRAGWGSTRRSEILPLHFVVTDPVFADLEPEPVHAVRLRRNVARKQEAILVFALEAGEALDAAPEELRGS